jgi:hypothetical protein
LTSYTAAPGKRAVATANESNSSNQAADVVAVRRGRFSMQALPTERPGCLAGIGTVAIELGKEVRPGIFGYRIPSLRAEGQSHQPLLDACRQIKRILGDTETVAGLFREGRSVPDISCSVTEGAQLTVSEPSKGRIRLVKFREFDATFLATEVAHVDH